MSFGEAAIELTCVVCGATQRCGPAAMIQRLTDIGMLKRSSEPDLELLQELLRSAAGRLACQACDAVGMTVAQAPPDDDQWEVVRHCDGCHQPISPERLGVFPETTRCPTCQSASENGTDQEREFCSYCGSVMEVRVRRSAGPAAYEMKCPNCRG